MSFCLDTNVAIELRDRNVSVIERVRALSGPLMISIMTRVELENGVAAADEPTQRALRRARVDAILRTLPALPFEDESLRAYAAIVAATRFSRRKILDRMIAAQALVHRATLVTLNAPDFADVPGLQVLGW